MAFFQDNLQNWEEDPTTLTQTEATAGEDERMWTLSWQAPAVNSGVVDFWITGNSVNGDQGPGPEDKWNQLIFALQEGDEKTTAMGTRTLFAGDGNVSPPNLKRLESTSNTWEQNLELTYLVCLDLVPY